MDWAIGKQGSAALRVIAFSIALALPQLALAQSTSPFLTGATSLQTNILAWADARRHNFESWCWAAMAMANRMSWGWCIGAILGVAIAFGAPQDRDLDSWDVRSVKNHERAKRGADGGICCSCRDTTADALGVTFSALLFNLVFTMEVFLLTKNLLTLLIALPIHGVCALLCARDARFSISSCSGGALECPPISRISGSGRLAAIARLPSIASGRHEPFRLPSARASGEPAHPLCGARGAEVIVTTSGEYVQTFRLGGASFESADDETLNNWHERLNVTWRNIASPNVSLWSISSGGGMFRGSVRQGGGVR